MDSIGLNGYLLDQEGVDRRYAPRSEYTATGATDVREEAPSTTQQKARGVCYRYLSTRLTTLIPAFDPTPSPFALLRSLSGRQWLNFSIGFFAWTLDALDFHTLTQTYLQLADTFGRSATDISVGVTLSLGFRALGAALFGIFSDIFGRKWPLVCNLTLLVVFELCTGFSQTYGQFLAIRALFGIAMGGVYGNAAATALEDCPEASRGMMSGLYQSGYPFGYLLAVVFWRAFQGTAPGWRSIFWFCAGPPVLVIIWRISLPETDAYVQRSVYRRGRSTFGRLVFEGKAAAKNYWPLLLYLVIFMMGVTYMSHASQDLYGVMLQAYNFQPGDITNVLVVANIGAMIGSVTMGFCSQIFGRRFSMLVLCLVGGALMYPYTFVVGPGTYAAAFFEQFCVQGIFGIVPIYLIELSPIAFRTFVVGTSYHLGVLAACASNTMLTTIAEGYPVTNATQGYPVTPNVADGPIYNYGYVMCTFMGGVFAFVILVLLIGTEHRRRSMTATDEISGRLAYVLNIPDGQRAGSH